jgi:hypothetical protein
VTPCNQSQYTRNPTLRLCGYVTSGQDPAPVVQAWFTVDGGEPIYVVPTGSGGFVDTSFANASEGFHVIRLYAKSSSGNVSFKQATTTVDFTPPVLTVLSPTSADVLPSTVVTVTSTVKDNLTPVTVETQRSRSTQFPSGSGTATHTIDLVNKGYSTLLVRAVDAAGNVTEIRTRVYVKQ